MGAQDDVWHFVPLADATLPFGSSSGGYVSQALFQTLVGDHIILSRSRANLIHACWH